MTTRTQSNALFGLILICTFGCGASQSAGEPATQATPSDSPALPEKPDQPAEPPKSSGSSTPAVSQDTKGQSSKEEATITEGLLLIDKRSIALDYNLNLGEGKGIDSGSWSFAEERSLRVKAAKKDVISEMQVAFGKWEAKPLLGLSYESPTNGKTYLLTGKDGGIEVVRGAGEKLSSSELASIKFEYGWVGSRSPLRQALLDTNLKSGAELAKSAELTQILLGSLPGIDPAKTEVTAVVDKTESGTRPKVTLKTHAKTRIVSNKTLLDLDLSGTTTVDLTTGWVLGADLSGSIQGGGTRNLKKHGDVAVSGKGKVTYTRGSEFR